MKRKDEGSFSQQLKEAKDKARLISNASLELVPR